MLLVRNETDEDEITAVLVHLTLFMAAVDVQPSNTTVERLIASN